MPTLGVDNLKINTEKFCRIGYKLSFIKPKEQKLNTLLNRLAWVQKL